MAQVKKLRTDVSEEELTSALMASRNPQNARALQAALEEKLNYCKAFLQAWTDTSGRLLEEASDRAELAKQSPSLQGQSELLGKHSVTGMTRFLEEYARLSHESLVIWSAMLSNSPVSRNEGAAGAAFQGWLAKNAPPRHDGSSFEAAPDQSSTARKPPRRRKPAP